MDDTSKLPPRAPAEVDFPYERVEAQHVARREFAKYLVVVSGGLAAGSGWVAVKDSIHPDAHARRDARVCAMSELPPGGMVSFLHPDTGEPLIVVHLEDGSLRAFEQKCTHLSCAVAYDAASKRIECPCHSGAFDVRTGAVLEGPPPRPLRAFAVERRGADVWLVAAAREA
jgi:nitrite reductase/ring-hydroxylating ferredoxin subunit